MKGCQSQPYVRQPTPCTYIGYKDSLAGFAVEGILEEFASVTLMLAFSESVSPRWSEIQRKTESRQFDGAVRGHDRSDSMAIIVGVCSLRAQDILSQASHAPTSKASRSHTNPTIRDI